MRARTAAADRVVKSVCPYCAVGCAQNVFVKDDKVVQIEGDPDSPISRGRLCPKGAATLQLTTGPSRRHVVLYRPPHATDWQELDLDTAMNMIADRAVATRRRPDNEPLVRCRRPVAWIEEVSRRRESHPPPLSEPGVTVSRHRAPTVEPVGIAPCFQ